MLQSVRGQFRDGVAHPAVPVERRDGQEAVVTFLPAGEGGALQAVHGWFRDGVARPDEAVEGREGQEVLITFVWDRLNPPELTEEQYQAEAKAFEEFLDSCAVDTGIPDLAHQHDHYLYGTPKKEDPYLPSTPKKDDLPR